MTRFRVCIIRRAYYPAESHVRRNAETLADAGYLVDLICLRDEAQAVNETINGVTVHRLPLRTRRDSLVGYLIEYFVFFLLASIEVSKLHIRHAYDVIEADSMPDLLIFTGLLPRLMGARLVLYLFESMPELWAQKRQVSMSHWTIRLLSWQEKLCCSFADWVICCHEMGREALVRRGTKLGKISVILNVPDERVFQRHMSDCSRQNGEFRIVQHGTITENYGIQVVLQALKLLPPDLPVFFDVVGEGEYRPALQSMICRLGLRDRVNFHGFVSRERLLELLDRANAGVVPMLFEYQSPNKMFEYVALGKPVIASDRRTFQQHFSPQEILYFTTGDPEQLACRIQDAICHESETREKADKAFIRYQDYRWQRTKEKYLGVYANLIKR